MATLSDVFHFAKRCRLDSEFSEVIDSCCYHCIEGLNGVDMGTRELVIFLQRFVPRPVIDSPKPDMALVEKLVHAHTVYRGCKAEKCEIVKRMVNYLFEVKPKSPALKEYIYKKSETMDIGDYWFDDEMYDIIISNLDWQRTRYTADNVHSCYFLLNTHFKNVHEKSPCSHVQINVTNDLACDSMVLETFESQDVTETYYVITFGVNKNTPKGGEKDELEKECPYGPTEEERKEMENPPPEWKFIPREHNILNVYKTIRKNVEKPIDIDLSDSYKKLENLCPCVRKQMDAILTGKVDGDDEEKPTASSNKRKRSADDEDDDNVFPDEITINNVKYRRV